MEWEWKKGKDPEKTRGMHHREEIAVLGFLRMLEPMGSKPMEKETP